MRSPVRKFVGVALMGAFVALCAVPMVAAGAQTTTTEPVQVEPASDCTFSVTGTFPNFTVSGTAPDQSDVTLYFEPDGGTKAAVGAPQPGPAFSFEFAAPGAGQISVGYVTTDGNAYTAVCGTVSGEVVVRVGPTSATKPAASLAFTGSSDTPSYVLIGIAAVIVGAVLVVAARRRSNLS